MLRLFFLLRLFSFCLSIICLQKVSYKRERGRRRRFGKEVFLFFLRLSLFVRLLRSRLRDRRERRERERDLFDSTKNHHRIKSDFSSFCNDPSSSSSSKVVKSRRRRFEVVAATDGAFFAKRRQRRRRR